MPSLIYPLQQPNKYKVAAKQWAKWPDIAQRVFNETYKSMLHSQWLFLHPNVGQCIPEHWKTTAHNAAWVAADATVAALAGIVAGKGYARKPKKK